MYWTDGTLGVESEDRNQVLAHLAALGVRFFVSATFVPSFAVLFAYISQKISRCNKGRMFLLFLVV
jgi:hypothetical protein